MRKKGGTYSFKVIKAYLEWSNVEMSRIVQSRTMMLSLSPLQNILEQRHEQQWGQSGKDGHER